jgi:hypothetical protein
MRFTIPHSITVTISPSYYYQPKDGSDTRSQVFKGCVNLLRSTISKGASESSLLIALDTVSSSLEPNKYKGFAELFMFVSQPFPPLKNFV